MLAAPLQDSQGLLLTEPVVSREYLEIRITELEGEVDARRRGHLQLPLECQPAQLIGY